MSTRTDIINKIFAARLEVEDFFTSAEREAELNEKISLWEELLAQEGLFAINCCG